jgi:hypothetical protein
MQQVSQVILFFTREKKRLYVASLARVDYAGGQIFIDVRGLMTLMSYDLLLCFYSAL